MSVDRVETAVSRRARWTLALTWSGTDRHRVFTYVAVFGLFVGALLAVLGLPPVDLHGPLHRNFGIMDPMCGGTRGVRYAMLGQWGKAWAYNPVSIPLVVGAVAFVVRHLAGWLTGHWLNLHLRVPRYVVVSVVVVLVVLLEVNQQLHASLLMGP